MPDNGNSGRGIHPVILSGGSGSRLWPVSRRAHPKPFMKLVDGESMAEKTFKRALRIGGDAPVLTVTGRDYYFYTRDLYAGVAGDGARCPFLLEPMGRNTAPAIAMAAHRNANAQCRRIVPRRSIASFSIVTSRPYVWCS